MKLVYPSLIAACAFATGCTVTATSGVCGDGIVDPGEQCDDGNLANGDGCSSTCMIESAAAAHITASWTFKDLATNTTTGCPGGQFDTVALIEQATDSSGNPLGTCAPGDPNSSTCFIDLFNCTDGAGTSAALPPTTFETWIEVTNTDGSQVYAKSVDAKSPDGITHVDVTTVDKAETYEILNDGGYFQFDWALVGASSGNPLDCTTAGATGGVEAIGTEVSNSANSADDIFTCGDGTGVTGGYLAASYTVSIDALNASMQSIGTASAITTTIAPQSHVTDLGTVSIPITGL